MEIYNGDYTVYAHINKANGKIYVGITKLNPEKRWRNGLAYSENQHFYNAILKYGWDGFEHEIIASKLTKEEACNFERILVEKLDLKNPEYGYNQMDGGSLPPIKTGENHPNYGRHLSEETRSKISKSKTGKKIGPHSEETKKKISEGNKGKSKPHTEEQKRLLSIKHTGSGNPNAKQVKCIETGEIFETAKEASLSIGKSISAVKVAIHTNTRAGGFHWCYI